MNIRIIIISYNSAEITANCIKSIKDSCSDALITVVDNASTDSTFKIISERFPDVKFIQNNENLGYSKAVNIGVASCTEKYIIISNSDIVFLKNSIQNLISDLELNIALVAPKQYYINNKPQQSSGFLPGIKLSFINLFLLYPLINKIANKFNLTLDYLDGAVLAIKRDVFNKLGGFDESFFFFSEDAEFSNRVKSNGMKIKVNSLAEVIHLRGYSTNVDGINIAFLEKFVEGKIKLSKLLNSKVTNKFYKFSEYFSSSTFKVIFILINKFSKSDKNQFKVKYYSELSKIWKKYI